jgi:hypothetical protein
MSLTPTAKKAFRTELANYCKIAEQYQARWHYTQNRPYTGLGVAPQSYHYDDCSAYVALAFWWAGHHTGHAVADPLGMHYSGWGNTDSCYSFIKAHSAPVDKYRIGDIALYLQGPYSHHHVTVCRRGGTATTAIFSSNGSEVAPNTEPLHYRSDLTGVYRHPALL